MMDAHVLRRLSVRRLFVVTMRQVSRHFSQTTIDLSTDLSRWAADESNGVGCNRVGCADRSATLSRGLLIGVILHELRTQNCRAWTSFLYYGSRWTSSMAPGMGGSSSSKRKQEHAARSTSTTKAPHLAAKSIPCEMMMLEARGSLHSRPGVRTRKSAMGKEFWELPPTAANLGA